jgi:hypothetical protein
MDKDIALELDAAIARMKLRQEIEKTKSEAASEKRRLRGEEMRRLGSEVVRPAMEEFAAHLNLKGIEAEISDATPGQNILRFTLFKNPADRQHGPERSPYLSAHFDPGGAEVRFSQGLMMPGSSGRMTDAGHVPIEAVTKEVVQKKLLALALQVLQ